MTCACTRIATGLGALPTAPPAAGAGSSVIPWPAFSQWVRDNAAVYGWTPDQQETLVAAHVYAPNLSQQAAGLPAYAGAFAAEWKVLDALDAQGSEDMGPWEWLTHTTGGGGIVPLGWRSKIEALNAHLYAWKLEAGRQDAAAVAAQEQRAADLIEHWRKTRPGGAGGSYAEAMANQGVKGSFPWGWVAAGLGLVLVLK